MSWEKKSKTSDQAPAHLPTGEFKRFTGSTNNDFSLRLLNQVIQSLYLPASAGQEYRDKALAVAMTAMLEIAPKDAMEKASGNSIYRFTDVQMLY